MCRRQTKSDQSIGAGPDYRLNTNARHTLQTCFWKIIWENWDFLRGSRLTWIVGLSLQDLQLRAFSQGVLQADLQEAGLGPAHPLQQRHQSHGLLALVPSFKPAGQHAHLIPKHHGPPGRDGRGGPDRGGTSQTPTAGGGVHKPTFPFLITSLGEGERREEGARSSSKQS